jgi:hypothetical protein
MVSSPYRPVRPRGRHRPCAGTRAARRVARKRGIWSGGRGA